MRRDFFALVLGEGVSGMMEELRRWIEEARRLPEPQEYISPADPLAALEARLRGDEAAVEVAAKNDGGAPVAKAKERSAAQAVEAGGERALGQVLARSLSKRPLPGVLRAEVAARLAALIEAGGPTELEEIWELVVFGTGDGS